MAGPRPNFFLIGAPKSGTTSLHAYLSGHPEVYLSPIKEPNYYCRDISVDDFSETYRRNTFLDTEAYFSRKELEPLHLTFVRDEHQYARLFEGARDERVVGECSTSYLYSSAAAGEIRKEHPEARLVAILRNPVERAFSHYLMGVKYGHTSAPAYEAFRADLARPRRRWGDADLYVDLGRYPEQLRRYLDRFPRSRLLILLFDDLVARPDALFAELCAFLEIAFVEPEETGPANPGLVPRHPRANEWLVRTGIKHQVRDLLGESARERVKRRYYRAAADVEIPERARRFLVDLYRDDVRELSSMLDRDLSHWLE